VGSRSQYYRPGGAGILVAIILVLCGCGSGKPGSNASGQTPANSEVDPVFALFVLERAHSTVDQLDPNYQSKLGEEFAELKAAALIGERKKPPNTDAAVELAKIEVLSHAAATAAGVYAEPTDAELKAAYERYVASQPSAEYHVAHILVATEPQAVEIIQRLERGGNFTQIARNESKDNSATQGGDIGWIKPGGLPKSFTDPLERLQVGTYLGTPVHTPYGWHVVRLIEKRPASVPSLDAIRYQLTENIKAARSRAFLADAVEQSKKTHP
jgi:peptidyl-prolyl cis-trans isomerase C